MRLLIIMKLIIINWSLLWLIIYWLTIALNNEFHQSMWNYQSILFNIIPKTYLCRENQVDLIWSAKRFLKDFLISFYITIE